jgi:hypothetical protein
MQTFRPGGDANIFALRGDAVPEKLKILPGNLKVESGDRSPHSIFHRADALTA